MTNQKYEKIQISCDLKLQSGRLQVDIYSEYWLFDFTGLGLNYSDDPTKSTFYAPDDQSDEKTVRGQLFEFSENKKFLYVKTQKSSKWSGKLNIHVAGSINYVSGLETRSGNKVILLEIGYIVSFGKNRFYRTKKVRFFPKYVFENRLPFDIEIKTSKNGDLERLPKEPKKFFFSYRVSDNDIEESDTRQVSFSARSRDYTYSNFVKVSEVGEKTVKITRTDNPADYIIITVQTRVQRATLFVQFFLKDVRTIPYLIENMTLSTNIEVTQVGFKNWLRLKKGHCAYYMWDDPKEKKCLKIRVSEDYKVCEELEFDKREHKTLKIKEENREIYIFTSQQQMTRRLIISDFKKNSLEKGIGYRVTLKNNIEVERLRKIWREKAGGMKIKLLQIQSRRIPTTYSVRIVPISVSTDYKAASVLDISLGQNTFKTKITEGAINYGEMITEIDSFDTIMSINIETKLFPKRSLGRLKINLRSLNLKNETPYEFDWCIESEKHKSQLRLKIECTNIKRKLLHHIKKYKNLDGILDRIQYSPAQKFNTHEWVQIELSEFKRFDFTREKSKYMVVKLDGKSKRFRLYEKMEDQKIIFLAEKRVKVIEFYLYSNRKKYSAVYEETDRNTRKRGFLHGGDKSRGQKKENTAQTIYFNRCIRSELLLDSPTQEENTPPSSGRPESQKTDWNNDVFSLDKDLDGFSRDSQAVFGSPGISPEQLNEALKQKVPNSQCPKMNVKVNRHSIDKLERRLKNRYALSLKGIGVSLVYEDGKELAYISLMHSELISLDFESKIRSRLTIEQFQIDVSLKEANYSLMLNETQIEENDVKPFLQMAIVLEKNAYSSEFTYIMMHYLSILIQEVDIRLEEVMIIALVKYFSRLRMSLGEERQAPVKISYQRSIVEKPPEKSTVFIDAVVIHLNPVAFNLTILLDSPSRIKVLLDEGYTRRFIGSVINGIRNVDNVPIRFDALILRQASGAGGALLTPIAMHYKLEAIYQLYKILGSLDFIGSPLQLVNNLGEGVYRLFYYPAKGFVKSPEEFANGMSRGALFFIHNSFQAVFGTASKITGKISQGISYISLDKKFIKKHKGQQNRSKIEGNRLRDGASNMGMGLLKGITGIVSKPLKGAKKEGFDGFVKGVGEGVLGVVSKPVVGVLDFVGGAFEEIAGTATSIMRKVSYLKKPKKKIRPTRAFSEHGLTLYSEPMAKAQEILNAAIRSTDEKLSPNPENECQGFDNSKFSALADKNPRAEQPKETLYSLLQPRRRKHVFVLSNKRLIRVPKHDFSKPLDEFEAAKAFRNSSCVGFAEIQSVDVGMTENSVLLVLKTGKPDPLSFKKSKWAEGSKHRTRSRSRLSKISRRLLPGHSKNQGIPTSRTWEDPTELGDLKYSKSSLENREVDFSDGSIQEEERNSYSVSNAQSVGEIHSYRDGIPKVLRIPCDSEVDTARVSSLIATRLYAMYPVVFKAYFGSGMDWIDVTETISEAVEMKDIECLEEKPFGELFGKELQETGPNWSSVNAVLVVDFKTSTRDEEQRIFFEEEQINFE